MTDSHTVVVTVHTAYNTVLNYTFILPILSILLYYIYKRYTAVHVVALYIYPLKGARGIQIQKTLLNRCGLKYDRQWVLLDTNNKFISQRNTPKLAHVNTAIDNDNNTLTCSIDGTTEPCIIPIVPNVKHSNVDSEIEMWGTNNIPVTIYADTTINQWFSNILGKQVKLATLRQGNATTAVRPLSSNWIQNNLSYADVSNMTTAFSDGFTISVASNASLRTLNKQIVADQHEPIDMDRFRMNIIVDGWSLKGFEEDNWLYSHVNDITIHYPKPIDRCIVPLINQTTGINDKYGEPTLALRKIHSFKHWAKLNQTPWVFGLNAVHLPADGVVRVGDQLHTTYRTEKQWFPTSTDNKND